jgi:hypothetical protein
MIRVVTSHPIPQLNRWLWRKGGVNVTHRYQQGISTHQITQCVVSEKAPERSDCGTLGQSVIELHGFYYILLQGGLTDRFAARSLVFAICVLSGAVRLPFISL